MLPDKIKNTASFTKVGQHEVVTVQQLLDNESGVTEKAYICRRCEKQWNNSEGSGFVQKALMEDCVVEKKLIAADFISQQFDVIPRGELVVVREVVRDEIGGIKMPENSLEGREHYVEAIGPKVEDLNVGDRVMMNGQKNVDWAYIPGCGSLIVINQVKVVLIFKPKAGEVK